MPQMSDGDGLGEGVAAAVLGGEAVNADELAVAAKGLHAEASDAALIEQRKKFRFEAAEGAVEGADGHLAGVPLEVKVEHGAEDVRALVAGEADVANETALAGFKGGLDGAARFEDPLGVVVVVDLVELPEVEVVHLEAAEAVIELGAGGFGVASTDLGHKEDVVAATLDGAAVALLADAVAVVPGGVEEGNAGVDGGGDDAGGFIVGDRRTGEVAAAETDDRELIAMAAESAGGERRVVRGHQVMPGTSKPQRE